MTVMQRHHHKLITRASPTHARNHMIHMMATTYRSQAVVAPSQELQLQTHDLQAAVSALSPEGILVKVHACGVCHSDVHLWHGFLKIGKDKILKLADRPGFKYPQVPGHEIAGSVYAQGTRAEEESGLKVGERVVVNPWVGCEKCDTCKGGDPQLCSRETNQLGFHLDGGYSEYVCVPHYKYVVPVPKEISDELATMLACSALTSYSALKLCAPAVARTKKWNVPTFIAIVGLGGLGQWALKLIQFCITGNPVRVVGVDVSEQKLKHVQESKLADDVFLFQQSSSDQVAGFLTKFGGSKPHIILDFVNSTETFSFSTRLLHKGGMLLTIGLHGGCGEIPLPFVALNALTIAGNHTGSPEELKELISLVKEHEILPPPIKFYALEEATQALQDLEKGLVLGRAVLNINSTSD